MGDEKIKISVRGKQTEVPSTKVGSVEVITTGNWLKIATIRDEDYVEGTAMEDPERFVAEFKINGGRADIFSFCQRVPDVSKRHDYPVFWDNAAAIPLSDYTIWWDGLSQETRRNVRLATKRGAQVSAVPFSDHLVHGIVDIYNETPIRQGRRFWHYGKDFETVKRENATFPERSQFIAAYCGEELIGFIKMVYADNVAGIMQILSKTTHQDKRPTNALIAKAVEICAERKMSHLIYCKYVYHRNYNDALTEFKRRNGFKEFKFPRYFVPLTLKGRMAIATKIQLGISEILPQPVVLALLNARSKFNSLFQQPVASVQRV